MAVGQGSRRGRVECQLAPEWPRVHDCDLAHDNTNAIMSAAPDADRGVASGLIALFRFMGQSSGIVASGTLLNHFATSEQLSDLPAARLSTAAAVVARRFVAGDPQRMLNSAFSRSTSSC